MRLKFAEQVHSEDISENVAIVIMNKSVTTVVEIGIAQNVKQLQKKGGLRNAKQSFSVFPTIISALSLSKGCLYFTT